MSFTNDISLKGKTKDLKRDGKWEIVDKKTGKISYEKITENYISEQVEVSGTIDIDIDRFPDIRFDKSANTLYLKQGDGTQYGTPCRFKNEGY